MPAITVDDMSTLPILDASSVAGMRPRAVDGVTKGLAAVEGAGFPVVRGFAGINLRATDPFILLDHIGPSVNKPYEAKGAPWHPHRGFETVTYIIDGQVAHHDSHGGGGIISDGDTQWMTAGAGILHDEVPTEEAFALGGPTHSVQLWVNLPARLKFTEPRYQTIIAAKLTLFANATRDAYVRLIAGSVGEFVGPGSTHTPITLAHATISPGSTLTIPWNPAHNAMVYALVGAGTVGAEATPIRAQHLARFSDGGTVTVTASDATMEVLLLGGEPINEPIVHHGPFVMNTEAEIREAIADYQAGRMGTVPSRRY